MAKVGEEDPRWIVKDMNHREDRHNVGKWYSSERDMLKEGTERLRTMLEEVELPLPELEGDWGARVLKLASCEGEIIFFDRTVNGVRKPTTVVDVQLKLDWEATLSGGSPLRGTVACPEISMEALEEGLDVQARITASGGHADAQCQAVRRAVGAAVTKLLDSVGRGFFQDLHEALHIPPPAIAPAAGARPKPKPKPKASPPPSPKASPTKAKTRAAPASPSKGRGGGSSSSSSSRKKATTKKGGGVKTSTIIAACVAAGVVIGAGVLIWRCFAAAAPAASGSGSSRPPAALQPRANGSGRSSGGGGSGTTAGELDPATASMLKFLSPDVGQMQDLRNVR
jgi:activator of HSP90 ATPase